MVDSKIDRLRDLQWGWQQGCLIFGTAAVVWCIDVLAFAIAVLVCME